MKADQAVLVAMVVAVLFTTVQPAWVEISCETVDKLVVPCLDFLTGKSDNPSPFCCTGVKNLKTMTPTTPDRQAACECLKKASSGYPNLNPDRATKLPKLCGVDFGVPISKDINCSKIP
ncbi:hypothetical protein Dsin_031238 [Dipteronia sinensis]|uniref:Non-specific lipid-transfer protein n=1 Tax=Dipteronia sinensis TaxID=43782 RepID=A0AAD9ZL76_9ROSI|nr:hypothetical protein Dsin_031238 [Dipteronia sinensis]